MLLLTGCSLSPLAKHATAFSAATTLVVTNSEDAYRTAIQLHDVEQSSDFVSAYEANLSFDPYSWKQPKPLISPKGLATRIALLDSLRVYAQSLVALTNGSDTASLDAAAKSLSGDLSGLTTAVNTDIAAGQASTSTGITIPSKVAPGIATGLKALGDYLANRKVEKQLPPILQRMDDPVRNIALLLEADVTDLRRQTKDDYEQMVAHKDSFIRKNSAAPTPPAGTTPPPVTTPPTPPPVLMTPVEQDHEIRQIPILIADQQRADLRLAALAKAIRDLALTHHALAAAAQHNDPISLKDRIKALEDAEASLASFYSSVESK
jgi:hypothetical protein